MRTSVSIPDDVFQKAERLAHRTKRSRNRLFSEALKEYVARHEPEEVTEAMNQVCAAVRNPRGTLASAAARRTLKQSEW